MADETRQYRPRKPLSRQQRQQQIQSGEQAGTLLSGALEGLIDVPRYSAIVANGVYGLAPGVRPEDTARRSQAINEFADNPPFLPKEMNNYRKYLRREHPATHLGGQVFSGVKLAGGLAKGLSRLTNSFRKAPKKPMIQFGSEAERQAALTAGVLGNEALIKPAKDALFSN